MKHVLSLLLVAIAVAMAGRPVASQDWRPGMIGADDRVRLEARGSPWDATGTTASRRKPST
jgi:hypothetical protein